MEIFASAMSQVLGYWWLIVIGTILGIFVGAVPGFSATNTLIILLPLTLGMQPGPALGFMASLYSGCQMGGSIPAVLFNVPGTGSAAVTCLDGYPMAQQGKAQQALMIAFVASTIGGFFTTVITVAALPSLRWVVYYFGTIENFIVILFGVALIAQIAGKNPFKGYVAGGLGLLLGAVGYDHVYSVPRATFGILELFDGVPRIPVIVGLFALSEAFIMIEKIDSKDLRVTPNTLNDDWASTLEGIMLTLKNMGAVIYASLIGFVVGIIPGAGASIGSFVSYQQIMAVSKDKDTFGKGNPKGVIAAEAANNGLTSGALIPLLTLGIPGGGTAAIMLIVMQAHGVPIGPRLFQTDPTLAYSVILSMLAAYVVLAVVGYPMIKAMAKTAYIPTQVLVPTIISFVLIGAFVERRFIFDMCLALFFGVLGYIMKKTDYPVHGVLLGVILGRLAEQYFLRGVQLGNGSAAIFFKSGVGNALWILLLISTVGPTLYTKFFAGRPSKNKVG